MQIIHTLLTTSRPLASSLSRNPNGAPPDICIVHSPSPTSTSGDVISAILSSSSAVGVGVGAAVYVSCSSLTAVEQRQAGHSRDRRLGFRLRSISSSVRLTPLRSLSHGSVCGSRRAASASIFTASGAAAAAGERRDTTKLRRVSVYSDVHRLDAVTHCDRARADGGTPNTWCHCQFTIFHHRAFLSRR